LKDLVVALSGGIGGAKLALGLSHLLPASSISACMSRPTSTR
jgi:2-phospho-L-lactate transferase/gluconeogenesis factor (CofD/UPF0052 family)